MVIITKTKATYKQIMVTIKTMAITKTMGTINKIMVIIKTMAIIKTMVTINKIWLLSTRRQKVSGLLLRFMKKKIHLIAFLWPKN